MKNVILVFFCLCSFAANINAQQRCCFAKQFTMNLKQMIGQTIHNKQTLYNQNAIWSHDATNMKQAWNGTTYTNGQAYPYQVIWDFNKKVKYDIDPTRKHCQKSATTDPMMTCIPAYAKFIGSGIVGDSTKVNGWSFSGHPINTQVTVFVTDPNCILTSEVVINAPHELQQMIAISGFNFTPSVNPNAFAVPSYCPPAKEEYYGL